MPSLSHTNHTPPHPTGNKGTGQPLCTHSVLHCSSRKHSLGTQTWRVMEEVDNALLRCVEEGSCHGVVLSISTEKLEGKERKSLDCQLWAAPQQGKRPFSSWCRAGGTAHSKHTNATALPSCYCAAGDRDLCKATPQPRWVHISEMDVKARCPEQTQGLQLHTEQRAVAAGEPARPRATSSSRVSLPCSASGYPSPQVQLTSISYLQRIGH